MIRPADGRGVEGLALYCSTTSREDERPLSLVPQSSPLRVLSLMVERLRPWAGEGAWVEDVFEMGGSTEKVFEMHGTTDGWTDQ